MGFSRSRPVQVLSVAKDVDNALKDLQVSCVAWQEMPNKKKVALLKKVRARALKASADIGKATAKVRNTAHGAYVHDMHFVW